MVFYSSYGFRHIKTSPQYPQANGLAESMVMTVKAHMEIPQISTWLSLAIVLHQCPGVD